MTDPENFRIRAGVIAPCPGEQENCQDRFRPDTMPPQGPGCNQDRGMTQVQGNNTPPGVMKQGNDPDRFRPDTMPPQGPGITRNGETSGNRE